MVAQNRSKIVPPQGGSGTAAPQYGVASPAHNMPAYRLPSVPPAKPVSSNDGPIQVDLKSVMLLAVTSAVALQITDLMKAHSIVPVGDSQLFAERMAAAIRKAAKGE